MVDNVFLAGFESAPFAYSGGLLLAIAIIHILIRWILNRRIRKVGAPDAKIDDRLELVLWFYKGLARIAAPLLLLLWILGIYFVARGLYFEIALQQMAPDQLGTLTWIKNLCVLIAIVWLLARIGSALESRLIALSHRTENKVDDIMLPMSGKALRLIMPTMGLVIGIPALEVSDYLQQLLGNMVSLLLIGVVAYLLFELIDAFENVVLNRYRVDVKDNLQARSVHTQERVLKKEGVVVIGILTHAT
ncbi:MAG: hypothetical protein AB7U99_12525, partial [Steroidobacteraceae bacterium]